MIVAQHPSEVEPAKYQLFDALRPDEYSALESDIRKRGVQVAVEVDENGDILDGHHRVEIARRLRLDYPTVVRRFGTEAEKREHVFKLNLVRRHLDPIQWGRAFARLLDERGVETRRGPKGKDSNSDTVSEIAADLGVNERTARRRLAAAKAYETLPTDLQTAVASERTTLKQALRAAARTELHAACKAVTAPESCRFNVLYADPPWRYEHPVSDSRRVENHYPTLDLEALKHLRLGDKTISDCCAEDCVLFLWATSPKLEEAFTLIQAWGFQYRTSMVWVKDRIGMGYYVRQKHEIVLIAKRGSPPMPEPKDRPQSVIEAPRVEHSAKPEAFYEAIEAMYPNATRLEVFARTRRPGWNVMGNQL
ncbi:MAG: MT-A70 family methyltransferase [Planctomycetota bacterium]